MRDSFIIAVIALFLIWFGASERGRMVYLILTGRSGEFLGFDHGRMSQYDSGGQPGYASPLPPGGSAFA